MTAYKLLRVRRDGTLGSILVNRKARLPVGVWMDARRHRPPARLKVRPGWHCAARPYAPHLTEFGRRWVRVEIQRVKKLVKPAYQGGLWYLAGRMKILEVL